MAPGPPRRTAASYHDIADDRHDRRDFGGRRDDYAGSYRRDDRGGYGAGSRDDGRGDQRRRSRSRSPRRRDERDRRDDHGYSRSRRSRSPPARRPSPDAPRVGSHSPPPPPRAPGRERDSRTDRDAQYGGRDGRNDGRRDERDTRGDARGDARGEVPPPRDDTARGHGSSTQDTPPIAPSSRSPTPELEDDSTAAMAAMMGFGGFDSTKSKKVQEDIAIASVKVARTARQYMNRKGGFNRPLNKIK